MALWGTNESELLAGGKIEVASKSLYQKLQHLEDGNKLHGLLVWWKLSFDETQNLLSRRRHIRQALQRRFQIVHSTRANINILSTVMW